MTEQQQVLINKIKELLVLNHIKHHACLDDDGYKEPFFRLFIDAYTNNYMVTGDQIIDNIVNDLYKNYLNINGKTEDEINKLLSQFTTMWNNWRYAWNEGFIKGVIKLKE